jgi:hypothetical protein
MNCGSAWTGYTPACNKELHYLRDGRVVRIVLFLSEGPVALRSRFEKQSQMEILLGDFSAPLAGGPSRIARIAALSEVDYDYFFTGFATIFSGCMPGQPTERRIRPPELH